MLVLGIFIFTVILGFVSGFFISICLGLIRLQDIYVYFYAIQNSDYLKFITTLVSLLVFLLWIYFLEVLFARHKKEKTIAFNTSLGQVSVSLFAVEDFIKRMCTEVPQIKDIRSDVSASRKGINVFVRLAIRPVEDLPQFTSQVQSMIKEKLQSLLGLEEEINIKLYISKIIYASDKKKKEVIEEEQQVSVPYREF
ncbi:MAG: hypothetical protein B6D55_05925 [Candidatus Omnitrophica bacterium 4484_70.2]|nr:MAG: hypothetical protein B6D55_05925 [Candidatus Omnitrophica bacterium 4484_70.2]